MDRKFIYMIVILLSITLVIADYYMNRSLESVEYLNLIDEENVSNGLSVDDTNLEAYLEEATPLVTLTITNKQSDNNKLEYEYTIKIDTVSGAHKYIKADGTDDYQVFAANGETIMTLKSNETITFTDIPVNSNYTITQKEVGNYKVYINDAETSTITGVISKDSSITFNNVSNTLPAPVEPEPEPEEPTKPTPDEPSSEKENPTTSDYIVPAFIALGILSTLLIISLRLKVKRFD